jgi:hypothetical protein
VPGPTANANASVLLTWDGDSLALFNQSNRAVDVSNLTFVQVTSGGRELSFESVRWEGGSRPTGALPPGDCFQVWRDAVSGVLPVPDGCDERGAWQAVGSTRWFWVSGDQEATFEVRRGRQALAVCPISAGECAFDPSEEQVYVPDAASASTSGQIESGASLTIPLSASVVLSYNADSLVLFNGTGEPVDVSGLTFVQFTAAGREFSFSSDRWEPAAALPSADCFQVSRDNFTTQPAPDYCNSLLSWQIVSSPRWFWISDNPNAHFQVRRGDEVLADCRIGDGQCTLDLDGANTPV